MRSIIHLLLNPVFILVCLLAAALLLKFVIKSGLAKIFAITFVSWLFIITVSPLPIWWIGYYEKQYSVFKFEDFNPETKVYVLVLGGGHSIDPTLPPGNQLSHTALGRVTEAIRIKNKLPESKIICSGYSKSGRTTQAQMLALTAIDLGILPNDTILLSNASNTEAEARDYVKRFGNNITLILVTDAFHMPRAMKWFRKYGIEPVPAPTNHNVKTDPDKWKFPFMPTISKITMMQKAMHEFVGNLEFELRN